MLVTEPGERIAEVMLAAVDGGVNAVQLRWKGRPPTREEASSILEVRERLRGRALLIVNSVVNPLANVLEADGIHFPEDGGPVVSARRVVPSHRLVGKSVHSVESVKRAEQEGVDYLVAGSIFETGSHPGIAPNGLPFLEDVCRAVQIPVIAIGGITPKNARDCLKAGAAGVAVLSGIMRAEDPRAAARAYRQALDSAGA